MKPNRNTKESFKALDKAAHDLSDVRPMSPAMRKKWEAAQRTGTKAKPGRPRKDPRARSRIVPISIDPKLSTGSTDLPKTRG